MSYISQSFYTVCQSASLPESHYVSLYCKSQYYGGPEEGGWWGTDHHLEAFQEFNTIESANIAKAKIEILASELTVESRKEYGEQCLRETAWLDVRGLDDSFLPEPDGPDEYYVLVEERPGQRESRGCRQYE